MNQEALKQVLRFTWENAKEGPWHARLTVAPLRRMGLRPSESTRYHVGIVLNT